MIITIEIKRELARISVDGRAPVYLKDASLTMDQPSVPDWDASHNPAENGWMVHKPTGEVILTLRGKREPEA